MDTPDSTLIEAARKNESRAWDTLLKRVELPLYAYAAELIGDQTAALDIVQETFMAAVRHIGSLRAGSRFNAWLFSIAHQKCIQHWRRTQRKSELLCEIPADDLSTSVSDGLDPLAELVEREDSEALFSNIARLPPSHRAVLLLHIVDDLSLEEISTIVGIPTGTVKSRLYYAKQMVRQWMEAMR